MSSDAPPVVVVTVHLPLLADALSRVLQRGLLIPGQRLPPGDAVQVITLDHEPDKEAVHVLHLPETTGDPALLRSSGHSISLVLRTLEDVAGLIQDLLARS